MSLIPNIDFTILNTSTLTPLTYNGSDFVYDFGIHCVSTDTTVNLTFCNLTSDPITLDNSLYGGLEFNYSLFPIPITIPAYSTEDFDVTFSPSGASSFSGDLLLYSGVSVVTIEFSGVGTSSLLTFMNIDCFLDFGNVGLDGYSTTSKTIYNVTDYNVTISISGNSNDFIYSTPITLYPGSNDIDFTFNPQTIGDHTTHLVIEGDCIDHVIKLCGNCVMQDSVNLTIDEVRSYVGCCSYPFLTIYNNYLTNNSITITNITYPGIVSTDQTFPFIIDRSTCAVVDFDFCPTISGFTSDRINVEYTYETGGVTFTGHSEIDVVLSAFTHPFATLDINCVPFHCSNVNTGATFNITNTSSESFQFYYLFVVNNGYDFYNIFETSPDPPITINPFSTTGITINFDVSHLTTGSSFSNTFYLKLIDPACCKEFIKCVNVHFCPTTVETAFGYPVNVSCYNNCDGEYAFNVTDCSGEYHIVWSSDTKIPLVTEVQTCRILTEDGLGCFGGEDNGMSQYYDQVSATDLAAGNYLLEITNACSAVTYHSFTITEPDPLFASITWTNPNNYCKSDLGGLCGIVQSPLVNPAGYVVIDKETLVKVINNDFHNIAGQTKRGYQQYDAGENQVAHGQKVDGINSFRNYILDFFTGAFINYKNKVKKEEIITVELWDDIVADTIGNGCCFASYVSGGTAPYLYQWYGPNGYTANSPNIFDRPCCEPYTLVVTDAHGCTYSATSTCLQCTFGIETLTTINPTCTYSNDGEIYVRVSGDCPNAVYKIELESSIWIDSHTASTYNFVNLVKDNYILRVENIETECKLNPINITLQPKYEFSIDANITGATCETSCDAIVEIIVNVTHNEDNIDPVFLYTLDGHGNYQNSNIFTGVCSGSHVIDVMNTLNYCEISKTITVPNLDLFQVDTIVVPATSPYNNDGQIIITVINGVSYCNNMESYLLEDLSLAFDQISNTFLFEEELVCLLVDEDGNCIMEIEDDPSCVDCGGLSRFISHTYTINNVAPGTYYFKITNGNGCTKTFKVIVGYSIIKKPKTKLFDSKRTDSYSGSKVTGNTPKGQ